MWRTPKCSSGTPYGSMVDICLYRISIVGSCPAEFVTFIANFHLSSPGACVIEEIQHQHIQTSSSFDAVMAAIFLLPPELLEKIFDQVYDDYQQYSAKKLAISCLNEESNSRPPAIRLAVSKRWAQEAERSWWKGRKFVFRNHDQGILYNLPRFTAILRHVTKVQYVLPTGKTKRQTKALNNVVPQLLQLCPRMSHLSIHQARNPEWLYQCADLVRDEYAPWLPAVLLHSSMKGIEILSKWHSAQSFAIRVWTRPHLPGWRSEAHRVRQMLKTGNARYIGLRLRVREEGLTLYTSEDWQTDVNWRCESALQAWAGGADLTEEDLSDFWARKWSGTKLPDSWKIYNEPGDVGEEEISRLEQRLQRYGS